MKRIFLFVLTNILVVLTISVVLSILSATGILPVDPRSMSGLLVFCFVWGMGGAFISLQLSRWMAKRAMGVRLVDGRTGNAEQDRLYNTIQNLSQQAGLPMPEVGVYDSPEVNAFATGPSQSRSLVAVSSGLLRQMGQGEVQGVLAHEIAHIKNGDMVTMTLIQGVINAFVMFFARVITSILFRSDSDDRRPGFMYFIVLNVVQVAPEPAGRHRGLLVLAPARVPGRRGRGRAGRAGHHGGGAPAPPVHPAARGQLAAAAHHHEDRGRADGALLHPPAPRGADRAARRARLASLRPGPRGAPPGPPAPRPAGRAGRPRGRCGSPPPCGARSGCGG